MKLTPKNWSNFQHYKHRSPPWIKLHKNLLDDMDYQRLPIASKALAPMLWLLASESNSGVIDKTTEEIAFRLRMSEKDILTAIKPLIDNGFFTTADNMLAECLQDATTEKSRVEKSNPEGFDLFWETYNYKVGKPNAIKEWNKLKIDFVDIALIVEKAKRDKLSKPDNKYRKHPERWIKGKHWLDEIAAPSSNDDSSRFGNIFASVVQP
jgi:hypothetical protein